MQGGNETELYTPVRRAELWCNATQQTGPKNSENLISLTLDSDERNSFKIIRLKKVFAQKR